MDNIAEQIVEKNRSRSDYLKMGGIVVGALLLASLFMFFSIITGFTVLVIFAVGILFGGVYLLGNMSIEYEYILTNNELDIDKIIGKRKRKRMITLDVSTAEAFAPYPPEEEIAADATVHASTGLEQDAYYLVVSHSGYGKVNLIFNPNEKIREAIALEVPNKLRAELRHGK